MFYYLVWVDMYTPGGSAFEFPLSIMVVKVSRSLELYFSQYRQIYFFLDTKELRHTIHNGISLGHEYSVALIPITDARNVDIA